MAHTSIVKTKIETQIGLDQAESADQTCKALKDSLSDNQDKNRARRLARNYLHVDFGGKIVGMNQVGLY